jgi:hypothetical protein
MQTGFFYDASNYNNWLGKVTLNTFYLTLANQLFIF